MFLKKLQTSAWDSGEFTMEFVVFNPLCLNVMSLVYAQFIEKEFSHWSGNCIVMDSLKLELHYTFPKKVYACTKLLNTGFKPKSTLCWIAIQTTLTAKYNSS